MPSKTFLNLLLVIGALGSLWLFSNPNEMTVYVTRLPSGPLFISEDPHHPALVRLRRQERLDPIVQGASTDRERVLRLAQWASHVFPATTPFPHYPPWNALEILRRIRQKETGGYCAQFGFVFGQACQSFGYGVRYVGVANSSLKSGHASTEVYLPSEKRWVFFEPEFGHYYVDAQGRPLGLLDLHAYAVGKKTGRLWKFPSQKPVEQEWINLFYNVKFWLRNNFLSVPVYHFYQQKPGGEELVFERYQMRWLDPYTAHTREAVPSLTSKRIGDFEFPLDLTQITRDFRCGSLLQFDSVVQQMEAGKVYRLHISKDLLSKIVESVLIQDPRFTPL